MNYSLLVSDLDGTFLDSKGKIPPSNKEAVNMILERGMRFAICSGRSHLSIDHFAKELNINKKGSYGIAFNGAVIYEADTLKVLKEYPLEQDLIPSILRTIEKFAAEPILHTKETVFYKRESSSMDIYIKRNDIPCRLKENMEEITAPVPKILLIGEHDELLKIKAYTDPLFSDRCNIFFSERHFLEFTDLKATKGNGLEFLADFLGIDIKQTIAVGDSFNDISMIEKAGLGIAVANGEEDAKKVAGYITETDNNSGVIKEITAKFFRGDGMSALAGFRAEQA